MPYFFYDSTYFLAIIALVISLIASAGVKSAFNRWSRERSRSGMTGAQAAELILRNAGITDVSVGHISGELTDNFNPTTMTLNLSDSTYGSDSIAAIGVAAHEAGHAIQHNVGYIPIKLRSVLVPVTNIGTRLSLPLILLGCFFGPNQTIITVGILLFALGLVFSLVTLPVEFNASHRALEILGDGNILSSDELGGAKKVLRAAAMTYVASTIAIALQLLRLILLFGRKRN